MPVSVYTMQMKKKTTQKLKICKVHLDNSRNCNLDTWAPCSFSVQKCGKQEGSYKKLKFKNTRISIGNPNVNLCSNQVKSREWRKLKSLKMQTILQSIEPVGWMLLFTPMSMSFQIKTKMKTTEKLWHPLGANVRQCWLWLWTPSLCPSLRP